MSSIRVRRLRRSDDGFIAELSRQAFAEFTHDPVTTTLAMAHRHAGFVAERDETPLGFAVLDAAPGGTAELLAIAVLESERGRGLGRLLLSAAEQAARRARASVMTLHTADANLAALELFHKRGYELERRLPRHYVGVFDAQKLRKRL